MAVYSKQEKAAREPTEIDWAWIAGFLEGEGSFCPMSGTDKRARLAANQNTREPLERLLFFLGGKIYKLHNRAHYVWMLRGQAAKECLIKLQPLMSQRRQVQIQVTLDAAFSVEHGSPARRHQRSEVRRAANQLASKEG